MERVRLVALWTPHLLPDDSLRAIVTVGGNVGISAYAPNRIATENTAFAMSEAIIGCFPDVWSTYVLARLDDKIETSLALTGNSISDYEIRHFGPATHYIPSPEAGSVPPPIVLSAARTSGASLPCLEHSLLPNLYGKNTKVKCKSGQDALALGSPASLKVTLEAVRMAEQEDHILSDALQRHLAVNSFRHFNTGATSILVNKDPTDKRPNWRPSTLGTVSPSDVWDTFFSPTSPYVLTAPRIQTERTSAEINLRRYALPSENGIDVVTQFEGKMRGVQFKVNEVLPRRCETMKDRRLKWNHGSAVLTYFPFWLRTLHLNIHT
ncbi:hypothetical protein BS47DRAFT_1400580 [Hydnum rufescens UP504]|uniref:3-hydroxyisobutyryl-CoA hydrolase n=1 Tax=Hydnum rufescens UP504 TaxID=1448309 RepID=A0A9P6DP36_9AGAM|nr:hypothetical protein BS47DRAFT_1400580 [Hydnum rufescens UP504]